VNSKRFIGVVVLLLERIITSLQGSGGQRELKV
jgi:hypothetical protein